MCIAEAQTWEGQHQTGPGAVLCPYGGAMLGRHSLLQSLRSLSLPPLQNDLPVQEDWRVLKKDLSTYLWSILNACTPLTHHKSIPYALQSRLFWSAYNDSHDMQTLLEFTWPSYMDEPRQTLCLIPGFLPKVIPSTFVNQTALHVLSNMCPMINSFTVDSSVAVGEGIWKLNDSAFCT